jgi:hydrogenase-4 membrane subunit HyfE
MVTALILLSAAALAIDPRFRSALVAYAIFTAATLYLAFPVGAALTETVFFAVLAAIKLIVGPGALIYLVRRYHVPENLGPSLGLVWRLVIVGTALVAAYEVRHMTAFAGVGSTTVVFDALFTSMLIVVLYRNLLAHTIGLLVLGSAITLAGAVFAPGLPYAIEIADTFDAVIATFVALTIARAVIAYDPRLDIRGLRDLRG